MSALHPSELNPYIGAEVARRAIGRTVLDVGCGSGFWMESLATHGVDVVGVEPDPARAMHAARHGSGAAVGDGMRLPVRDESVDVVWCIHILHHIDDPVKALGEIARVLRPGGELLLAETVEDNPLIRTARRVHPHWDDVPVRSRFTVEVLDSMLAASGFAVEWRRRHSLVAFAAWLLPVRQLRAWRRLVRIEERLVRANDRWGAHYECVAVKRDAPPRSDSSRAQAYVS